MHASGVFPDRGPATLERSRRALLDALAHRLTHAQAQRTTIVFDAQGAPPGLPSRLSHQGITVLFAPRKLEADELLEELIGQHSAPRRLTVVSSDHRVQRAARRRRAKAVDSDVWMQRLPTTIAHSSDELDPPLEEELDLQGLENLETKDWLRFFGDPESPW